VRVSAKAVYSKYNLQPASCVNFGAIIKGTKKTQVIMLENKGMLHFKFRIHQAPKDAQALQRKRYEKPCPTLSPLSELFLQGHLSLGVFTVSPCSGSIAPWGQQKITVECFTGQEGPFEETIYFDILCR
ncbi:HYDIN protein, partial [Rhipidura dahli]|nr:HYDIN protein [Rhipidura dahli]